MILTPNEKIKVEYILDNYISKMLDNTVIDDIDEQKFALSTLEWLYKLVREEQDFDKVIKEVENYVK